MLRAVSEIYLSIYVYACVCVCVCAYVRFSIKWSTKADMPLSTNQPNNLYIIKWFTITIPID